MQDGQGYSSSLEALCRSYVGPGSYDSTPSYLGSVLVSPTLGDRTYRQHQQREGGSGCGDSASLMASRAQARILGTPHCSPGSGLALPGTGSPVSISSAAVLSPVPAAPGPGVKKPLPLLAPGSTRRQGVDRSAVPAHVREVQLLPAYKT